MRTDATTAIQSATTSSRPIVNRTRFDGRAELLFPAVFLTAGAERPDRAPEVSVAAPMTAGNITAMEVDGVRLAAGDVGRPVITLGTVVSVGRTD
jgi:hypothetical protein